MPVYTDSELVLLERQPNSTTNPPAVGGRPESPWWAMKALIKAVGLPLPLRSRIRVDPLSSSEVWKRGVGQTRELEASEEVESWSQAKGRRKR